MKKYLNKYIILSIVTCIIIWFVFQRPPSIKETNDNQSSSYNFVISNILRQEKDIYLSFYGQVSSERNATIVSECTGYIKNILANDGDLVCADQPLIEIDTRNKKNIVSTADANLQLKQEEYYAEEELYNDGYSSYIDFLKAQSALKQAEENTVSAYRQLSDCTVKSPFDGKIDNFIVTEGNPVYEYNTELIRMFDHKKYIAEIYINEPSKTVVKIGQQVIIESSNCSKKYEGTVFFISNYNANNNSSYLVKIRFNNPDEVELPIFSSVRVFINTQKSLSFHVPSPALSLDMEGNIGIKIIENRQVKFVPVTLIEENRDGAWVYNEELSAQEQVNVITIGNVYAKDGYEIPDAIFDKMDI
ncbi:MAG: efflux transporter, RND family, MFP subunit [Candidatus Xenolissoclinum pacificiensis L6]|uniref:Efflux transporter, RND family, MFP subunit n=1 Tax=Candidatus Xenolissoclinum pacificiensis L6 TaxID=1401685 RepID=W2UZX7_9RICK|nr:MAG: efflux transporter, RND family, MFP subunit [Candidatus Xenolissoclinum pacificiensis L6]